MTTETELMNLHPPLPASEKYKSTFTQIGKVYAPASNLNNYNQFLVALAISRTPDKPFKIAIGSQKEKISDGTIYQETARFSNLHSFLPVIDMVIRSASLLAQEEEIPASNTKMIILTRVKKVLGL